MATRMDENTVTANFVTFVNCLSLSERRNITEYLFSTPELFEQSVYDENKIADYKKLISEGKLVKWNISYHTDISHGLGCEPDIEIKVDDKSFYIEVKTNYGAALTLSERKNGNRKEIGLGENHVYLVPENYDLSDKIPSSPVCRWSQLKEFMNSEEIECGRFFSEIGQYIEDFNQEGKNFTKGDVVMLYEPKYVKDVLNFMEKIEGLIKDCDTEIINKLKAYDNKSFSSGKNNDKAPTVKSINYKGKDWDMGYGYNVYVLDFDAEKDVDGCEFNVFVRPQFIKCDVSEEKKDYKNNFGYSYFPLDKKIFEENDYKILKEKFIDQVVDKLKYILCLDNN